MSSLLRFVMSALCLAFSLFITVSPAIAQRSRSSVIKTFYGTTSSGVPIEQYTLTNTNGMEVTVITYGALLTSIENPSHKMPNIVLGFNNLNDYETKKQSALRGSHRPLRQPHRQRSLHSQRHHLLSRRQQRPQHPARRLQGAFDTKVWTATKVINDSSEVGVELNYLSPGRRWLD